LRHGLRTTFVSLRNPNFRAYFAAQVGSNIGAWIQITAENWLVLQLSDSGLALGITNALQFGPLVFFGLYGGLLADRFDRRRLLIATQSVLALLAGVVGVLVTMHLIQLWMIWVAALLLGLVLSADRPALLSFVKDLVDEAELPNAVALNNTLVVLVLTRLDRARLQASRLVERKPGQVREGLSYVRHDAVLRPTVVVMGVVFVAAYNFQVLVPLLASRVLDGASELYGAAMSCLGLGAVSGSLLIAARVRPGLMMIAAGSALLSIVHVWLAFPSGAGYALSGLLLLGITSGFFNVTVSSTLQVRARDDMRGRVMALYSIGILGSSLIGAPLAGTLADTVGMTVTLLLIATICAGTAIAAARSGRRPG
jgi:MFS family permease